LIDQILAKLTRNLLQFPGFKYDINNVIDRDAEHSSLEIEELNYDATQLSQFLESTVRVLHLNSGQNKIFNYIKTLNKSGEAIFIDGPGGTGKTHLYKCILAHFRSQKQIVIAVASSGIASLLLSGGRTAHSRFKIPIKLVAEKNCNLPVQSPEADLIKKAALILWDEALMMH
jgi:hypothetical protein